MSLTRPQKHGEVLVTGSGDLGQLGLGSDILEKLRPTLLNLNYEIVDVCAGGMHTVLLTSNGNVNMLILKIFSNAVEDLLQVLTFGCNDEGALGRDTSDNEDSEFVPEEVDIKGKVVQISAGDSHTTALTEHGTLYTWGTFRV